VGEDGGELQADYEWRDIFRVTSQDEESAIIQFRNAGGVDMVSQYPGAVGVTPRRCLSAVWAVIAGICHSC